MADVLDADESNFIKSVLNVINPKVTLKIDLKKHKHHLNRFSKKTASKISLSFRMGPTIGLVGWMRIVTRDSSGCQVKLFLNC